MNQTVTRLEPATSPELLTGLAEQVLAEARQQGASSAETAVSRGQGLAVTVRLGAVETVEHHRDKGLSVTVYFGHRSGSASTSDFSAAAVRDTVRAACTIARYTAEDPCNGLADAERLAREIPDLDLYHPWGLSMERAIDIATQCEQAALDTDLRIKNSEGASVSSHDDLEIYANSLGFVGRLESSRHGLSCAVIGETPAGMQRDYWYSAARSAGELEAAAAVGQRAAERTVRRLGARRPATAQVPVVFGAPVAGSLLGHLVGAIRGSSLYRKASFLLDQLGQPVFPAWVRIHEQPHLRGALGSAPFDNEGVATAARDIVADGVLQGYVLGSYAARKLGMQTTGNAGGVHNLTLASNAGDLAALLKRMDRGLLVTELIGFGVNTVTGDYSRGAAGFWVENGQIAYPVEEFTIAGNLRQMFAGLIAVGNDVDLRGNVRTGSILVDRLTVAGQ